jgi:thioredoxin reductase (NADPH)
MEHYDVTIIGSGPAGCTAAIYAARYGYKVALHEGIQPGGQLMNKATTIENFPSYESVSGADLMGKMIEHANGYVRDGWKQFSEVESLEYHEKGVLVNASTGPHTTSKVIVASGSKPKMLPVEGIQSLIGKGVSTCATCDGFFFRGKSVTVVGGGDSAMEAIIYLSRIAKEVVSVHRSSEYRASKVLMDRANGLQNVVWWPNTEIVGIGRIEGVLTLTQKINLEDGAVYESYTNGDRVASFTDGLFVCIGHTPNKVKVEPRIEMQVHYAGDVVDTEYQQAITAAAEGCRAAMQIHREITRQ